MLSKEFGNCLSNLWQKCFENGNFFGNIDFLTFNVFFQFIFFPYVLILKFDRQKKICFNGNLEGAK